MKRSNKRTKKTTKVYFILLILSLFIVFNIYPLDEGEETKETHIKADVFEPKHGEVTVTDTETGEKTTEYWHHGEQINQELYELMKIDPFDLETRYEESSNKEDLIKKLACSLQSLDFYNKLLACNGDDIELSEDIYSLLQKGLEFAKPLDLTGHIDTRNKLYLDVGDEYVIYNFVYIGQKAYNQDNELVKDGLGIKINSGGNLFIGYWKNDKQHGKAINIDLGRKLMLGNWVEGIRDGVITCYYIKKGKQTTEYYHNGAKLNEEIYKLKQQHPFNVVQQYENCVDKKDFITKELTSLKPIDFYNQLFYCTKLRKQISAEVYSDMQKALSLVNLKDIIDQVEVGNRQLRFDVRDYDEEDENENDSEDEYYEPNVNTEPCEISISQVSETEDGGECMDGLSTEIKCNGDFEICNYEMGYKLGKVIKFTKNNDELEIGNLYKGEKFGNVTVIDIQTQIESVEHNINQMQVNSELLELTKQPPFDLVERYNNSADKKTFIIDEVAGLKSLDFYNQLFSCTKLKKQVSADVYSKWQKALALCNPMDIISEINVEDSQFIIEIGENEERDCCYVYIGQVSFDEANDQAYDGFGVFLSTYGLLSIGYRKNNDNVKFCDNFITINYNDGKTILFEQGQDEVSTGIWAKGKQQGDHKVFNVETGKEGVQTWENGECIETEWKE